MHRGSLWNKTLHLQITPNNSLLTSKPWQELWSSQDTLRAGSWDYQADKEASWPHLPYKQERSDHSPMEYDTDTASPRGNYSVTWTGITQPLCRRVKRAAHTRLFFRRPCKAKPDWWCGFLVTVHSKYLWPCPSPKRWTQPFDLLSEQSTPRGPGSAKPAAGKSPSRGEKRLWAASPRLMPPRDISWQNEDNQKDSASSFAIACLLHCCSAPSCTRPLCKEVGPVSAMASEGRDHVCSASKQRQAHCSQAQQH